MNKKGFTLIELLVVIAIIGILSTLSVIALNNARQKSRDARRVADIKQVQTALELFYNDESSYPATVTFDGSSSISGTTAASTTYMAVVPANPLPADTGCTSDDYIYTRVSTGTYYIHYCLANITGGVPNGWNHATPAGISDGSEN